VKHSAVESPGVPSLAETHTEGLLGFVPEILQAGRGCLLQILPATPHAEMQCLTKRRTLIGRDLCCDISVQDTSVSRLHAAIDCDDTGYLVLDLGSRNGTFVDDRPLKEPRRLHGGELIRMGSTVFKFMAAMDEEAQYHAAIHELMNRDSLTGIFNRSYLISTLNKLVPQCQRTSDELSVIMIDIDFFKTINDTHGHLIGDVVLRLFSERLRSSLRPTDALCRFGGEEFVVVSHKTCLHDAVRVSERLRLAVSSVPFETTVGKLKVTCSLGVASLNHAHPENTAEDLLSQADHRLYAAKNSGRNRVCSVVDSETHA